MKPIVLLLAMLYAVPLAAQNSSSNPYPQENTPEYNAARAAFYTESDSFAAIFNGRIPAAYPGGYQGTFYIYSPNYLPGTLWYDGKCYQNVMLNINAHKDQLYVLTPSMENSVAVNPNLIGRFTIQDRSFAYYKNGQIAMLPEGCYEQLYDGNVKALLHVQKVYEENIEGMKLLRQFTTKRVFYVVKNGTGYPVSGQGSLLKLLSDHKQEMKQMIKRNRLDFRGNPEVAYGTCMSYYDGLISQKEGR